MIRTFTFPATIFVTIYEDGGDDDWAFSEACATVRRALDTVHGGIRIAAGYSKGKLTYVTKDEDPR